MVLREGQIVGHFRVLEPLGAGGMGEVWRARDERLSRDVALKVLHGEARPESLRTRLLAEARALSALHHPHIVVVHEVLSLDQHDVLVMEFVAGEPLSTRLQRRPIPQIEVLKLAAAVADALAAAHRVGVVHRDLKPANVLIAPSGTAKVIDFGLARQRAVAAPDDPTIYQGTKSSLGVISGTPAYMSPEQAEGMPADHRSDVFSFGALLYELLTGRSPFARDTVVETLHAVVKDTPELPASWPRPLARIVEKCLRKQPERRFQSMADVKLDLDDAIAEVEHPESSLTPHARPRSRGWWRAALATTVALSLIALAWWWSASPSETPPWRTWPLTSLPGIEEQPVLSPAGDVVAFIWDGGVPGRKDLYVQPVVSSKPPLPVSTHAAPESSPTWSPDGTEIAVLRWSGNAVDLVIMSAFGGAERVAATTDAPLGAGGGILPPPTIDWSPDGRFIALPTPTLSMLVVATGEIIKLPQPSVPGVDRDPVFSPDGRRVLYTRGAGRVYHQVWMYTLDATGHATGDPTLVVPGYRSYIGLTWLNSTELLAGVGWWGSTVNLFRASIPGTLRPVPIEPVASWYPGYSPERKRLVYQRRTIDTDVMAVNLTGEFSGPPEVLIRSTYEDREAKYSPDGSRIVFISTRSGHPSVWRANADGSNQILLGTVEDGFSGSPQWTPDGKQIVFDAGSPVTGSDVYIVSAEGGTPRRIGDFETHESGPAMSSDGQWIYFGRDGLWKMRPDGRDPVQVAEAGGYAGETDEMLYISRANSLWRMPKAGGSAVLVKKGLPGNGWTVSGGFLYELQQPEGQRPRIVRYQLADLTEAVLFEFAVGTRFYAARHLSISPDGRTALVPIVVRDESDLVVVDGVE